MQIASLFRKVLTEDEIISDEARIKAHTVDWRGRYTSDCGCVLVPRDISKLQEVLRIAHAEGIAVTPQGGNTSLCGGSIPSVPNSVILLLERIASVRSFSALDQTVTVEAGMVLSKLQDYVAAQGFYFPLSLASEASCQIGGNIACNAGGIHVLRYGTMRDLVVGLEVVLPNGEIISHLASLHKNTTGFESKHLWIGSEGTLGVITAATLKVFPPAREKITVLLTCKDRVQVLTLLRALRQEYVTELTSFEYIQATLFNWSETFSGIFFRLEGPEIVLCELSGSNPDFSPIEKFYEILVSLGIFEAIVARSPREARQMWTVRENISAAQKFCWGVTLKHDIAVPIEKLDSFITNSQKHIMQCFPDAKILLFGHFGDGSLHYDVALARDHSAGVYRFEAEINQLVYEEVLNASGTIAAEHGIGQLKVPWLSWIKTPTEIKLMKDFKARLDPHHIMNPGKLLG